MGLLDAPGARRLTAAVEGIPLWMYGNSYGAAGITANTIFFDRIRTRLRSLVWFNASVPSFLMPDISSRAYGYFTAASQGSGATAAGLSTISATWASQAFVGGVVLIEPFRNDAGRDGTSAGGGTTAKSRAGATNALDAWLRIIRSVSLVDDSDAAWTYASGWNSALGVNYAGGGGSIHYTYTPGAVASANITVPASGEISVILMAIDSAVGAPGAPYKVTCTGKADVTGTTNDQMRVTPNYPGSSGLTQMAVPFSGLTPSSTVTVTIQKTGAADSSSLWFDEVLCTGTTPPTIIVLKPCHLPTAGYTYYNALGGSTASTATDDIYGGIVDTVLARFPNDNSVISFNPNTNGWNPATMISSADGAYIHPDDIHGSQFYADKLEALIYSLPARNGLVRM